MRRTLAIVAGAAAFVLWHVATLTRSPIPYFDDTFFASIGDAFARTGELRLAVSPLWIPGPVYLYGPAYFVAQTFVFQHFGFGIFQNRILGVLGGLATMVVAFAVLCAAGVRRRLALGVGLLLALDPTLNASLHGGRMDDVALAGVLAGVLALQKSRTSTRNARLAWCVASGVLAALAILTTPRSAYLVAVLAAVLGLRWARDRTREGALELLGWGLPLAALYALWIAYAFGGVAAFLTYYRRFSADYVGGTFLVRSIHYPLLAALLAIGALRLGLRRPRVDELTVFALAGIVAFYALGIDPPRYGVAYSVFMTPLAYLAMACLASDLEARAARRARLVLTALLVFNAAAFAARATLEIVQWRSRDPGPVEQFVRTSIPPGSRVVGDDKFYFAVRRAGSDFQYWQRGGTLAERVAYHADVYRFDYVVTEPHPTSDMFRAYAARVPLVEVAALASEEPGPVATALTAIARGLHLGAPLVGDYAASIFVRTDRAPERR